MNTKDLTLSQTEIHKLLSAGSGDAALLHLYLQCGNAPREAEAALGMSQARYSCAAATLRQLGLWPEESVYLRPAQQPPQYTEEDVTQAMNRSEEFRLLNRPLAAKTPWMTKHMVLTHPRRMFDTAVSEMLPLSATAYLTIRFTSLFFTTMVFTIRPPCFSRKRATFSSAWAAAMTASSGESAST